MWTALWATDVLYNRLADRCEGFLEISPDAICSLLICNKFSSEPTPSQFLPHFIRLEHALPHLLPSSSTFWTSAKGRMGILTLSHISLPVANPKGDAYLAIQADHDSNLRALHCNNTTQCVPDHCHQKLKYIHFRLLTISERTWDTISYTLLSETWWPCSEFVHLLPSIAHSRATAGTLFSNFLLFYMHHHLWYSFWQRNYTLLLPYTSNELLRTLR